MHKAWLERWRNNNIGWHEADGNQNLKRYWQARGKRVLVPLCGKSPDLLWLEAQGNEVVGVEVSDIAVQAFFDDNELDYERNDGQLIEYRATRRNLTLLCGDYFSFRETGFDAHFDRGALIALPPDLRGRYAAHTSERLLADATQLVITVEYEQSVCAGPPYSVEAAEVQGYWPRLERIAATSDIDNAPPKFINAGLSAMQEVVWQTVATI